MSDDNDERDRPLQQGDIFGTALRRQTSLHTAVNPLGSLPDRNRKSAFHCLAPNIGGINQRPVRGNLSHPPDTGVSAAERRFPIFPSSLPNEGLRPKRLLIAHKRQLGECPDAVVARRGSDRAVARYRHTPVAGRASWAKRLICGRRGEQTCRGQSRSARSHAVVLGRDVERGMGQKGPRHFHCSANAIKT